MQIVQYTATTVMHGQYKPTKQWVSLCLKKEEGILKRAVLEKDKFR